MITVHLWNAMVGRTSQSSGSDGFELRAVHGEAFFAPDGWQQTPSGMAHHPLTWPGADPRTR